MRGNCCPNRHFFLDGDRELLRQGSRDTVTNQGNTGTEEELRWSSPLTVRVRREVARERREEVDLETGSRRSWVETRELEVLDLTGNFPGLALSVSLSFSPGQSPVTSQRKLQLTASSSRQIKTVDLQLTGQFSLLFIPISQCA